MRRVIVVAGIASGTGKTTVATGLMAALARRGTAVAPFKVGPDYIDPGYHTLAAGRPGRNLDPVLVGEHRLPGLLAHGARDAEVAVVEGVMGLFDGRVTPAGPPAGADPSRLAAGSTARVAEQLGAPMLLVVDARGQGRGIAAVLHGVTTYRTGVRFAGVVLNQVGSPRHERLLREACDEVGLPVLGVLPRHDRLAVPSRHLGLVTAAEHGPAATRVVDAMAELVAGHVDLDAVLAAAAPLAATGAVWDPATEVGEPAAGRPVVAVAGGRAFSFGYAEHAELLAAAGAEVVVFDPARDERLPGGTAALVLPGGFPEEHGPDLSANTPLRAAVAALARSGAPVHAECGGLLYLADELDGRPMCGVLPGPGPVVARMTSRLSLGYRSAVALTASSLFEVGRRVTGHEFHRTVAVPVAGPAPAWRWAVDGVPAAPEGYVHAGVHASYLHTHPAGQPDAVARFVTAAARPDTASAPAAAGRRGG